MMSEGDTYSWRNAWFRRSVVTLVALFVIFSLIGFVWLPSVHSDFSAKGLWASICRAAGVPARWVESSESSIVTGPPSTKVVMSRALARSGPSDAVGRGATLALNCTMCHGAQGMSVSDAPNLAGQLKDYRSGLRTSSLMESIARSLSDANITDLAAYYASLPKARSLPTTYADPLPRLIRTGDPLRNIAPCIACHGSVDSKLGAPWLEGMPRRYLISQLNYFASGTRRNDSLAQMRNMARNMTPDEIAEVSFFYSKRGLGGGE
jgi:cytochrome c553